VLSALATQLAAPSALLTEQAPDVRLVRKAFASDIADTIRLIDGMVAPPVSRFELADARSVALFTDRWVCVVDAADPRTELSLEELAAMPWVARPDEDGSGLPAVRLGVLDHDLGPVRRRGEADEQAAAVGALRLLRN
jgi:hypothetical protein